MILTNMMMRLLLTLVLCVPFLARASNTTDSQQNYENIHLKSVFANNSNGTTTYTFSDSSNVTVEHVKIDGAFKFSEDDVTKIKLKDVEDKARKPIDCPWPRLAQGGIIYPLLHIARGRRDNNEVLPGRQNDLGVHREDMRGGQYRIHAFDPRKLKQSVFKEIGSYTGNKVQQCFNPQRPAKNLGYMIMITNEMGHDLHGKVCPHHYCTSSSLRPENNVGGDCDLCSSFCVQQGHSDYVRNFDSNNRILSIWIDGDKSAC